MAKVTNTSNQEVYLGTVKVAPHSVAEVPDEELQTALENKMVESWFANGTLKRGEVDPNPVQTNVHPNVAPEPSSPGSTIGGGVSRGGVVTGPGGVIRSESDKETQK